MASALRAPPPDTLGLQIMATWRSGYAAACKAVYTGSIPVVASMQTACKTALFGVQVVAQKLPKTGYSPKTLPEQLLLTLTSYKVLGHTGMVLNAPDDTPS